MKTSLKALCAGLLVAFTSNSPAKADVLVTYTFPGAGNNSSPIPVSITNASGVTGGDDLGTGLGADVNSYVSGWQVHSSGNFNGGGNTFPADLSSAQSDNSYYELTVTPDPSTGLDLTNLDLSGTTFAYQLGNPASYTVEESTDDFTTTPTNLMTYSIPENGYTVSGTDLSLTGLGSVTTPVEFRIYTYGETGAAFIASVRGSAQVIGSVVPEPSAYALLLAGGIALAGLSRRSARKSE